MERRSFSGARMAILFGNGLRGPSARWRQTAVAGSYGLHRGARVRPIWKQAPDASTLSPITSSRLIRGGFMAQRRSRSAARQADRTLAALGEKGQAPEGRGPVARNNRRRPTVPAVGASPPAVVWLVWQVWGLSPGNHPLECDRLVATRHALRLYRESSSNGLIRGEITVQTTSRRESV